MSQCVPNWELDDPPNPTTSQGLVLETSAVVAAAQSRSDYKLKWIKGHLSMNGLERLHIGKSDSKSPGSWDKALTIGGTLESMVDQTTGAKILFPDCHESPTTNFDLVPNWLTSNTKHPNCTTNATSAIMDGLVPCANNQMLVDKNCTHVLDNIVGRKRMRDGLAFDDVDVGFTTSTSPFDCSESTSCGRPMTIIDDHHSACHTHHSQREDGYVAEENQKDEVMRSSISTKRSRAAAVHNQSERKRRDKINQRMKTLQKLVPNSSKTDKASMLDEVIDYLKQLQAQVQMMNILTTMPQMLMPMQQMQMSMMAQMAQMGMGMPMPMALDMTAQNRSPARSDCFLPPQPPMHPPTLNPFAMPAWNGGRDGMPPLASSMTIPIDPFSAFNMACQAQKPMSMDAVNRMAANMYQQMYHQTTDQNPTSNSK